MPYNPHIHHRRSIRLKGYDYLQEGLYFITICVQDRKCLFEDITVGAPLVDGQNDSVQNDGVIQYDDTNNNGVVQNETDNGNDVGRLNIDIGRPQGHAPTDVQNNGIVRNDGVRNDAKTHAPIMILNDAGKMIETEWLALKIRFPNIELHEFVVMPNHFHAILQIVDSSSAGKTVGDMMDAFKSITTVEYIHGVKQLGWEPF